MFVDSHCHLAFPELAAQLPAIRAAMAQAQVTKALCICTTLEEFDTVHALAVDHDNFWCSVGVHPDNEDVREFYLGMGGTDRKSFRDVKSYKRRKRWLA